MAGMKVGRVERLRESGVMSLNRLRIASIRTYISA